MPPINTSEITPAPGSGGPGNSSPRNAPLPSVPMPQFPTLRGRTGVPGISTPPSGLARGIERAADNIASVLEQRRQEMVQKQMLTEQRQWQEKQANVEREHRRQLQREFNRDNAFANALSATAQFADQESQLIGQAAISLMKANADAGLDMPPGLMEDITATQMRLSAAPMTSAAMGFGTFLRSMTAETEEERNQIINESFKSLQDYQRSLIDPRTPNKSEDGTVNLPVAQANAEALSLTGIKLRMYDQFLQAGHSVKEAERMEHEQRFRFFQRATQAEEIGYGAAQMNMRDEGSVRTGLESMSSALGEMVATVDMEGMSLVDVLTILARRTDNPVLELLVNDVAREMSEESFTLTGVAKTGFSHKVAGLTKYVDGPLLAAIEMLDDPQNTTAVIPSTNTEDESTDLIEVTLPDEFSRSLQKYRSSPMAEKNIRTLKNGWYLARTGLGHTETARMEMVAKRSMEPFKVAFDKVREIEEATGHLVGREEFTAIMQEAIRENSPEMAESFRVIMDARSSMEHLNLLQRRKVQEGAPNYAQPIQ